MAELPVSLNTKISAEDGFLPLTQDNNYDVIYKLPTTGRPSPQADFF